MHLRVLAPPHRSIQGAPAEAAFRANAPASVDSPCGGSRARGARPRRSGPSSAISPRSARRLSASSSAAVSRVLPLRPSTSVWSSSEASESNTHHHGALRRQRWAGASDRLEASCEPSHAIKAVPDSRLMLDEAMSAAGSGASWAPRRAPPWAYGGRLRCNVDAPPHFRSRVLGTGCRGTVTVPPWALVIQARRLPRTSCVGSSRWAASLWRNWIWSRCSGMCSRPPAS